LIEASIFNERYVVSNSLTKWSKKKEKVFKKNQVESKNIFHKLAKASNYTDVGISPFV
jgi:hypothetical protein